MINYEQEKEQAMKNYKFCYPPKVGEPEITCKVVKAEVVKGDNPKANFAKNETIVLPDGSSVVAVKSLGYHYEYTLDDGKIMIISSSALKYHLDKLKINDGDVVIIGHPVKGEWSVRKV